jgi:hypothetical protein
MSLADFTLHLLDHCKASVPSVARIALSSQVTICIEIYPLQCGSDLEGAAG